VKFLHSLFLFAFILLHLSCSSEKSQQEEALAKAADKTLTSMEINENTENILYTYMDEKGQYVSVEKSTDVPDPCRNDVIIINLNLPPEARQADVKVLVADLETRDGLGFKLRLEDRASFENSLKLKRKWRISPIRQQAQMPQSAGTAPQILPNSDEIILYGASWCGYCKQAKKYLHQKGVKFREEDIEKNPQASVEMQQKCAAAKIQCNGVPVIDFKGVMIPGFDRATIDRLIASPPIKDKKDKKDTKTDNTKP